MGGWYHALTILHSCLPTRQRRCRERVGVTACVYKSRHSFFMCVHVLSQKQATVCPQYISPYLSPSIVAIGYHVFLILALSINCLQWKHSTNMCVECPHMSLACRKTCFPAPECLYNHVAMSTWSHYCFHTLLAARDKSVPDSWIINKIHSKWVDSLPCPCITWPHTVY